MHITALPQDVLRLIFAGEDVSVRCSLACTCRHFRDLSVDPGLWEAVDLDVGKLKRKGSPEVAAISYFLAKRISDKTRMTLKCTAQPHDPYKPQEPSEWPRESLVTLLTSVGTSSGTSRTLTKLALDLDSISVPVQAGILGILPWMKSLRELRVSNICLADSKQLNALSMLSELENLALEFNTKAAAVVQQPLQGGFPDKLASLTHLKHLCIHRAGYLGSLPEEIGQLSNLESLDLSKGSVCTGLPKAFSSLRALTSVRMEHFGTGNLSGLAWLPKLRNLHLNSSKMPVELASCSQLTALTLLLASVPEHQIEIGFSRMLGMTPQAPEWQKLLPRSSPRAARLSENLRVLHIADTKLSSVPQAVTQLPNLQRLSLAQCSLFDLPEGAYTSKLKTLILKHNFFTEVPQSLRGRARELQKLDLSYNLLRPSETDIDTVLQLPSLRQLWVTKTSPQPGPEFFRQSLSSWTAYSIDCLFKLSARHAVQYPGCPLNLHIFEPPSANI